MKYLFVLTLIIFSFPVWGQSEPVTSETRPAFPGGNQAFLTYIKTEFKYPPSAIKVGYSGQAKIRFSVEPDGKAKVKNIDWSKMYFRDNDKKDSLKTTIVPDTLRTNAINDVKAELVRLIESMPEWKPGTRNGKKVKVYMSLPYNLNLY